MQADHLQPGGKCAFRQTNWWQFGDKKPSPIDVTSYQRGVISGASRLTRHYL